MKRKNSMDKEYKNLEELKEKLGVSDERARGMIETLFRNGYTRSEITFLTQVGQAYSFVMDDIQAELWTKGKLPGFERR